MASDRPNREQRTSVREALVGESPAALPRSRGFRGGWAKPLAAIAVVATLGAFAYRFAAPRRHDFAAALDQAERLIVEGRLAEAGSLLLGRIGPERMAATPEESLRFETVHQSWLDAVKAAREAKREKPPVVAAAPDGPPAEASDQRQPDVVAGKTSEAPLEPPATTQVAIQPETPVAPVSPAAPVTPDGEATLRLAEADADAGRHEAARMRFESAISLGLSDGSMALARLGLAETHASLGDHEAARLRYSELARAAGTLTPPLRERAAGSMLDRVDSMLALGELESALGYAEIAEPLVVGDSRAEVSLAVRRASTRLALANRLVAEGDRESARPLARAAALEFLRADGIEVALGAPPEGFAEGTFARLAGEAMRVVAGDAAPDRPSSGSIAIFLRAESRREAGLAASRALLAATPEAREALIQARIEAYASALSEYDSMAGEAERDLATLASSRAVECLVALNRVPEAIARLERMAEASTGADALAPIERGIELARHARDAAALDRLLAAGRAALAAASDESLAALPAPRSRSEWQRTLLPTGIASVPDRP